MMTSTDNLMLNCRCLLWRLLALLTALGLHGCGVLSPTVDIGPQNTARPADVAIKPVEPPKTGTIYSAGSFRPMFENRRARYPGDILTIRIAEKTSASQRSNSTINRTANSNGSISALPFLANSSLTRTGISGTSQNQFQGEGETGSNNVFTGDITVTVIEVLGNGNLKVAGEKQVGLNGNVDRLRFSGVISPDTISPSNDVQSTLVADARLDFRGRGPVGEAQVMGWLSRFFLSFLPI